MDGVRVGNRLIGTQSPVTVGWENIPRVEGGPVKQVFFTWFQPVALFALVAFWYYAPNSIAKASTAVGIGIGFKVLLLALEWVNPRYESWRLTWKEAVTDLFYVGLTFTLIRMVDQVSPRLLIPCDEMAVRLLFELARDPPGGMPAASRHFIT